MPQTIAHAARHPDPSHVVNERFLGFTFAGADLVAEADAGGIVAYAAGAFQTHFGRVPETFVGQPLRELIAPGDHATLDTALVLLAERGRLLPMMIRISDAARTPFALAGLVLRERGGPPRLCLSFARPPVPAASVLRAGTLHGFARATEARMRAGGAGDLKLIEFSSDGFAADPGSEAMGRAFESAAPDALAAQVAPGRYGLLGGPGEVSLAAVAEHLESALRAQGVEVAVAAQELPLTREGLTPVQAARALRQALNVFARDGGAAFAAAGFEDGLAGYIRQAGVHTASLRRVIRDGRFSLSFQPIVVLADRTTHHFEALIRPETVPGCNLAEPQDFVMLVEALGLADELDLAVARLACDAAARTGVPVAFNLSGQSVQNASFRDRVHKLLTASEACRAGLIIVEMTETAEIEDVQEAARTADALRSLGIPFCLDDFGAGGADVRLLRALTPDIVKLDGSYVPGVTENGRERALVAGMVEIARGAGAEIVAERTETEGEAEILQRVGVHYGQGWLFGRPGPLPVANRHPSLGVDWRQLNRSRQ